MSNPFFILGAYPEITKEYQEFKYNKGNYYLYNDENYCDRVDMNNLRNPENIFEQRTFYTDFPKNRNNLYIPLILTHL